MKRRRMVRAEGELSVLSTKMCVDGVRKENTVATIPFPFLSFHHYSDLRKFLILPWVKLSLGFEEVGQKGEGSNWRWWSRVTGAGSAGGSGTGEHEENEAGDEEQESEPKQRFGTTVWTQQQEEESGEAASVRFPEAIGDQGWGLLDSAFQMAMGREGAQCQANSMTVVSKEWFTTTGPRAILPSEGLASDQGSV